MNTWMSLTNFGSGQLFTASIRLSFHSDSLGLIHHHYYYPKLIAASSKRSRSRLLRWSGRLCLSWASVGQVAMDFGSGQVKSERLQFFCLIIVELSIKGRLSKIINQGSSLQELYKNSCHPGHRGYIMAFEAVNIGIATIAASTTTSSVSRPFAGRPSRVVYCQLPTLSHQPWVVQYFWHCSFGWGLIRTPTSAYPNWTPRSTQDLI